MAEKPRSAITGLRQGIAARRRVFPIQKYNSLGLRALFGRFLQGVDPFNLTDDLMNPADIARLTDEELYGLLVLVVLDNPPASVVTAINEAIKAGKLDGVLHARNITLAAEAPTPSASRSTRSRPSSNRGVTPYVFERGNLTPVEPDSIPDLTRRGYTSELVHEGKDTVLVFTPPNARKPTTRSGSSTTRTSATTRSARGKRR